MFEFQKLCRSAEALSPAERAAMLADLSVSVIARLNALAPEIHPAEILASFIIGSVVSDGSVSEKDYLGIYPSLAKAFGEACDLAGIRRVYKVSKDVQREISGYTRQLLDLISVADEQLAADIIFLCLLVTSVDGKVSLKEQRYIKQLCRG